MAGKTKQPSERWDRHREIPQEQEIREKEGEPRENKDRQGNQEMGGRERGKVLQADEESTQGNTELLTQSLELSGVQQTLLGKEFDIGKSPTDRGRKQWRHPRTEAGSLR